jgi:hypothetical protein
MPLLATGRYSLRTCPSGGDRITAPTSAEVNSLTDAISICGGHPEDDFGDRCADDPGESSAEAGSGRVRPRGNRGRDSGGAESPPTVPDDKRGPSAAFIRWAGLRDRPMMATAREVLISGSIFIQAEGGSSTNVD